MTWEGKAVPEGTITFQPSGGGKGKRPATGAIGKDGTYELTSYDPGDGALAGEYNVSIMAMDSSSLPKASTPEEEEQMLIGVTPGGRRGRTRWHIPVKYADASMSQLKATVNADDNEINFDLP